MRGIVPVLIAGLVLSVAAPAARSAVALGDVSTSGPVANPDAVITFFAALPHRAAALEQAATAISAPGSSSFRQYLSVEEAAQRYGATDAQITAVREAARSLGLKAQIDPTGLLARISGPVSAWEKAMGAPVQFTPARPGVPYDRYLFPAPTPDASSNGDQDFWRTQYDDSRREISFPGPVTRDAPPAIAATVTAFVASYSDYIPALETPAAAAGGAAAAMVTASRESGVQGEPRPRSLYGPGDFTQVPPTNPAAALMKSCVTQPGAPLAANSRSVRPLTPGDFVGHEQVFRAYGLPELQRREGANAGGRVTIISYKGGYSDSDLAQAARCFGFTKPEVRITRGTGVGSPFVNVDLETTLDVQTVSATLRNARAIQLVQVAQPDYGAAFADGYARALTASPRPHAITLSYGICEPLAAPFGMFPTVSALFRFAAVVGTTITVSAGDGGSSSCQQHAGMLLETEFDLLKFLQSELTGTEGEELRELQEGIESIQRLIEHRLPIAAYPRPTVDFPASSPWATAVGGTQVVMNPDGTRAAEIVWNDQPYFGGAVRNSVGTGGPSAVFNAPAYQRPLTRSNTRSVPDISAMAGFFPALPIVAGGMIEQGDGTSQSSPMMAAALALLSAQEVSMGRPRLGFVNPWLYDVVRRNPQTVYDVTIGDNQYAIPLDLEGTTLNIPACCQAGLGYDQATGLGVLNFKELSKHTVIR